MTDDSRGVRTPFTRPRSGPAGRTDRALAIALFALLYAVYLATFSGTYHSSDEMTILATTDSLARRGAWDVELLRWMDQQQQTFGLDGHLYSRKSPGMSLAALPLYWLALQFDSLGNVHVGMLTNVPLTALIGVLVFLALRRLHFGQGVALLTSLAFGLGTMAWPYARYLYGEPLAALGLMLGFYFLLRFRDEEDRLSALLAGVGLAVAVLARINNAVAIPFLGLLLLTYLYRRRERYWQAYLMPVLLFGLPVLVALGFTGWFNWWRFGSPFEIGYLPGETFSRPFFEGLYGLTLSAGKGLFWYNPLLIAAAAAWPALYRRLRAEALLVAAIVLTTIVFYAPWYLWWGGHAWGPRFLVSLLPFAVLPLAVVLELAARLRALAVVLAALAAVSVVVQVLGVAVSPNLYLDDVYTQLGLYHPVTLFDPAYSPLIRQWAYLSPGNLDILWAHGESARLLLVLVALPVLAALILVWTAWVRKPVWYELSVVLVVIQCPYLALLLFGPGGDVAVASQELAALERPGEVAVLADELLTEAFQNSYDGHLPIWGVPDPAQVFTEHEGTWLVTTGQAEPAPLRFQAGKVALAFYPAPGGAFDASRLPDLPPESGSQPTLGGVVELMGMEPDKKRARCSTRLPVTLWWRALAPVDTSYTVFIQVIADDGTKAGQVDRLPCDGGCPTTFWQPGSVVGERYDVAIDCTAPEGRYDVIAGMYDLETGVRLPVHDAAGNPAGDHLLLGTVGVP